VIKSGHIVEIYEYQNTRAKLPIPEQEEEYNGEIEQTEKAEEGTGEEKGDRTDEYKQRTNIRARNQIRRLINMNFNNQSLFVTLTFAKNIQDIAYANDEFKKFIKRIRRKQDDFAYVSVMEFQKRGAIHYHMVCNWKITWETHEELQWREQEIARIWRHGFCDIQEITKLDNVGAYLIKYMTKDNVDDRLNGKKRYFHSRNLDQPIELTGEEARKVIEEYLNKIPVFTNEYSSEWTGKVMYREYNPLRWDREK
jgi:hypothetical protein